MLSKKTLENNNFAEGQFQSVVSSLNQKKSYRATGGVLSATASTFGSPMAKSKMNPRLQALGDSQTLLRQNDNTGSVTLNSLMTKNRTLRGS